LFSPSVRWWIPSRKRPSPPSSFSAATVVMPAVQPFTSTPRPRQRSSTKRHVSKLCTRGATSDARLRRDSSLPDGGQQCLVIALRLIGIGASEFRQRAIEDVARSHVGGDRNAIARARVCAGERPGAETAV